MKREFKSESKKLLELMIHSIYSNKDIFLRELLSNASDALDKKQFYKAQGKIEDDASGEIKVKVNKENREIIIQDNGIGMNEEELDQNLGTIAHSGSKEFMEKIEKEEDLDVIGQFGVGFYASFIVADKVKVETKKENESGYLWVSDGTTSYEVEEVNLTENGTKITLTLKEGESFDKYLDESEIENLIKEHSNYVKYPIKLYKEVQSEESEESIFDYQQVNSQVAIWKKNSSEVTDEEYKDFYLSNYMQFDTPLKVIHKKMEGVTNNNLLLFIPSEKSFDYNTPNYKAGIDLYSKGILIDKNVSYLLPEYFNFVKGLIDTDDLELNISREMLQKDDKVNKLKNIIENSIKKELEKLIKKDRENYIKFYENYGRTLMFGVYDGYGANAKKLEKLIMFKTNKSDEYITLTEYLERNKDNKSIYYISGISKEAINAMPIMEKVNNKDIEVLYLLNDVDEFALQILGQFNDVKFESILMADIETEEEKKEIEEKTNEYKDELKELKEYIKDDVSDIELTTKLTDSFATIKNKEGVSIEQEKIIMQNPEANVEFNKVLELNPNHEMFKVLMDSTQKEDMVKLIYQQARIQEGLNVDNPKEFNDLINKLIK